jgi:DNA-binding NtrC family response regulator
MQSNTSIVIVSNCVDNARDLSAILSSLNYNNFRHTLETSMASSETADIYIVDIGIGISEEVNIISSISESNPGAMGIIACSEANIATSVVQSAIRAGAMGFIKKPFSTTKILNEIEKLTFFSSVDKGGEQISS